MPASHSVLIGVKAYSASGMDLLKKVFALLKTHVEVAQLSSIYKVRGKISNSKGIHDLRSQESFSGLSVVVKAFTSLEPPGLLSVFQKIEDDLRSEVLHRSVSVNLLIFEGLTLMTPGLTLPHPEFHLQPEVLVPAAEVWGDYHHPILKDSIFSLSKRYSDENWGEFYTQGKSLLDF